MRKAFSFLFLLVFLFSSCNPMETFVEKPLNELIQTAIPEEETTNQAPLLPTIATSPENQNNSLPAVKTQGAQNALGIGFSWPADDADTVNISRDIASLGVQWVRQEFPIELILNSDGSTDFSSRAMDRMVQSAREEGLSIVALLDYGPAFKVTNKSDLLKHWERYVSAIVHRYGGLVDHWEIQNEPNLLEYWQKVEKGAVKVNVPLYVDLLRISHKVIKDADPSDEVILGGLGSDSNFENGYNPVAFVSEVSRLKGGNYFDSIGLHLYWGENFTEIPHSLPWGSSSESYDLATYADFFAIECRKIFGRPIPIWVTEIGFHKEWLDGLSQQTDVNPYWMQAAMIGRSLIPLLSMDTVKASIIFNYRDQGGGEGFAVDDGGKKMLRALAETVGNAEFLGVHTILDSTGYYVEGFYDLRFRRDDGQVFSWFWIGRPLRNEFRAYLKGELDGPTTWIELDAKGNQTPLDLETEFWISGLPAILEGGLTEKTQIVVGDPRKISQAYENPIVYEKEFDIWTFFPYSGESIKIADGNDFRDQMSRPFVSRDGKYLAYDDTANDQIVIYEFDSKIEQTIHYRNTKKEVPSILMGWDDDNRFYYSLNSKTSIYRFDPLSAQSEKAYDLPSHVDGGSAGGIYELWVSSSGQYAIGTTDFYLAKPSYASFIFEEGRGIIHEVQDFNIGGICSIAENEANYACPIYNPESDRYEIQIRPLGGSTAKSVNLQTDSASLESPVLSPTGKYLLYSQTNRVSGLSQSDFEQTLHVFNIESQKSAPISFGVSKVYPVWSADETRILIGEFDPVTANIQLLSIDWDSFAQKSRLIDEGKGIYNVDW